VFDFIGRRIDEAHGIRADRDDGERVMIRREAHAVCQDLSLVERAQIRGRRIAEPDHAKELVVHRIDD
jgi:hypothetical protein